MRSFDSRNADQSTETADPAPVQLFALVQQALVAQATELARSGRYDEAEAVLEGIKECPLAQVLDLRARIKAQQGLMIEAASLWGQALKTAPDDQGYAAAMRRALRRADRPQWLARPRPGLAVLAMLALALLVVLLLPGKKGTNGIDAKQEQISAMRSDVVQNGETIAGSSFAKSAADKELQRILVEKISLKGIKILKMEEKATITFEEGLFSRGTRFRRGAETLLVQLGAQIGANAPGAMIQVVGCTDDKPLIAGSGYADNSALGLARAVTAIEVMRNATGLPVNAFIAQSTAGTFYPYSNDGIQSKMRNRTVLIKLMDPAAAKSLRISQAN